MAAVMDQITEAERKPVIERIAKARTLLATYIPFFGHLLLKLKPVVTRRIPLAGVTPDHELLINPEWAMSTQFSELCATCVHEVLHPAFLVWERKGARNIMVVGPDGHPYPLFFVAHDYAINLIIRDMIKNHTDKILDPEKWDPKGLIDEKFRNWSAEEIYDHLAQTLPPGGKGRVRHEGADASKDDVCDSSGEGAGSTDDEGNEDTPKPGGRHRTELEKKAESDYWKVALLEAAQIHAGSHHTGQGDLPLAVKKFIAEILDPRVPWWQVMSRWVGEKGRRMDFSYRRPSRRSDSIGETLPSLTKHGVADVVVVWDTSGSMNGREKEVMPEVIGICTDLGLSLRVICCDAEICSDQSDVERPEDVDVRGGGGSNFIPAFEKLDKEGFDGVVVAFTDGYIGVPATKPERLLDCLWVNWKNDCDPTHGRWGQVLNIDAEGYTR